MYIRHEARFGKNLVTINAGELYVSSEDEVIGTVLGSCVAVCLYDSKKLISGMNHFMLPGRVCKADLFADNSAKYGIVAIRELVESMEKKGARRESISAKVFGGGRVIDIDDTGSGISQDNVRLARAILEIEDISITHVDHGGNYMRKLFMDVTSGKVFLKKTISKTYCPSAQVRMPDIR